MDKYIIYTAASTDGNPGKGGCSAIIMNGQDQQELARTYELTTPVRMSIMAVLLALETFGDTKQAIEIQANSDYIVDTINKRRPIKWEQNNWHKDRVGWNSIMDGYNGVEFVGKGEGEPVKHKDLWQQILPYMKKHKIKAVVCRDLKDQHMNDAIWLAREARKMDDMLTDDVFELTNSKSV
jgi:ribonuclease HI